MSDYAELRAALDALSAETEGRGIPWFDREQDLREVATGEFEPEFSRLPETDMNYIAAANPEAIRALLAERDAFADVLEAIASIKATPGRAKADALLASVVNLAWAALAQEHA